MRSVRHHALRRPLKTRESRAVDAGREIKAGAGAASASRGVARRVDVARGG